MRLQRAANYVEDIFGTRITGMVGGNLNGLRIAFGNNGTYSSGNQVTVDRQQWNQADRRDQLGMLVHEFTHVATRNQGLGGDDPNRAWGANSVEQGADAVRYALLGSHGISSETLGAAKRIANREGWTDMNQGGGKMGPGLPGLGAGGGRMRNTMANVLSKNKVDYSNPGGSAALPALSPQATAAYYGQLSSMMSGLQSKLQGYRLQRQGLKAGFQETRAGAKSQAIADMSGAVGDAIGRGVLNSSADLSARSGVRATQAQTVSDARNQLLQGLAQTRLSAQQDIIANQQGMQQLQANYVAQQQEALAQELQQNAIVSGQEASLDAIKAMYNAFMQNGNGGRHNPDTAAPQFDVRQWLQDQAKQTGQSLPDYLYQRNQARLGIGA